MSLSGIPRNDESGRHYVAAPDRRPERDDAIPRTRAGDLHARLAIAALELFEQNGYDSTTVEDIAKVTEINRRTFFRHFPNKEDVLFADQPDLITKLGQGLEYGSGEPIRVAGHALAILLDSLIEREDLLRRRDALIQATPALADRELVWWGVYQQVIGDYLSNGSDGTRNLMFAKIVAAAVLAAYRQVVTGWLRSDEHDNPKALFSELLDDIAESMTSSTPRDTGPTTKNPPAAHPDRRDVLIISSDFSSEKIAALLETRRE